MTINTKDSQAVDILRDKNENFPNIDLETIELCKNYLRVSKKALIIFGSCLTSTIFHQVSTLH